MRRPLYPLRQCFSVYCEAGYNDYLRRHSQPAIIAACSPSLFPTLGIREMKRQLKCGKTTIHLGLGSEVRKPRWSLVRTETPGIIPRERRAYKAQDTLGATFTTESTPYHNFSIRVAYRSGRTIEYPPRPSKDASRGLTSEAQNSGRQMASICRPETSLSFLSATRLPLKYTVGLHFVLFRPPAEFSLLTCGKRTCIPETTRGTLFTTIQTAAWR